MQKVLPEFEKRNVKVLALSVDGLEQHKSWVRDIQETQGVAKVTCAWHGSMSTRALAGAGS